MNNRLRLVALILLGSVLLVGAYYSWKYISAQKAIETGVVAFKNGNYQEAFNILQPYAAQGDVTAKLNLAVMYAMGLSVSKDRIAAEKLFKDVAPAKAAEFYLWVAQSYEKGDHVIRDEKEAMAWYKSAADAGSEVAKAYLRQH